MASTPDAVLIPLQLDAFILNPAVAGLSEEEDNTSDGAVSSEDGSDHATTGGPSPPGSEKKTHPARISPIVQPNYTFLRLQNHIIQPDVQNHIDLHTAHPYQINSRMSDLGARPSEARRNRYGVYVHWILPRAYRSGTTSSSALDGARLRDAAPGGNISSTSAGAPPTEEDGSAAAETTSDSPRFLEPPTRWIFVRKLDMTSLADEAKPYFQEYQAWVIESDYMWQLDKIPAEFDMQVDVSPFVAGLDNDGITGKNVIERQAEIFIGRKTRLEEWKDEPDHHRADIGLLSSGNELFADFQLHNSNVFSTLDNFVYSVPSSKPGTPPQVKYLDACRASYYLVGWHSKIGTDPLMVSSAATRASKLKELFINLQADDAWSSSKDPARLLCHGAMYDVNWNVEKKPENVPADYFSARLKSHVLPAVSVGTTPMDALITYCTARRDKERDQTIKDLEEHILAIDTLLRTRDDGVESQREAKDMLYTWNYSRIQGGIHYRIGDKDKGDGRVVPADGVKEALDKLNRHQLLIDACRRTLTQLRWDMFSLWWKWVSDVRNEVDNVLQMQITATKDMVDKLSLRITEMSATLSDLEKNKADILQGRPVAWPRPPSASLGGTPSLPVPSATVDDLKDVKMATLPFYYQAREPTVLVGGIDSGWAVDFLDQVRGRLLSQVVGTNATNVGALKAIVGQIDQKSVLPDGLSTAANALLGEFVTLRPDGGQTGDAPSGKLYPQFHDTMGRTEAETKAGTHWRDRWLDTQPWFPLFAEWEVEYTHIPFEYWSLTEQAARLSDNPLTRYGIKTPNDEPLYDVLKRPGTDSRAADTSGQERPLDQRRLSGRVLILPQASFSLAAKIKQLFDATSPSILDTYLTEAQRSDLVAGVSQLSYLSAPLAGLTNELLTLSQGHHLKPEYKRVASAGDTLTAIPAALDESAGFTKTAIEQIQGNSALTPFGTLTQFTSKEFCPFKPVTHGQFKFRKFNIIDKFGQALSAIDTKPTFKDLPPPMFPCISDFYEPQLVKNTDLANTVRKQNPYLCEYMQIPPQINQNSRLNASFVVRSEESLSSGSSKGKPDWRPVTEWENPIWGWIVLNYADYGIQFFLPNGVFYREVRIGGPNGTLAGPKWIPFKKDSISSTSDTRQLDALLGRLDDKQYTLSFWSMLTEAINSIPPAPTAYAEYLNSIVGKPLALVDMGWSLELASAPLRNESLLSARLSPNMTLLKSDDSPPGSYYKFKVKIGDRDRVYDGLVGYFDVTNKGHPDEKLAPGNELNLDTIHTYFTQAPVPDEHQVMKDPQPPLKLLEEYETFEPFWLDPASVSPDYFTEQSNARLQVFGAILDPFTPVHAYSSFMPTRSLQLPSWTWQDAMNTMTAFFHAGPLTITKDVPEYEPKVELSTANMKDTPATNLPLPALGAGDWNWLQPYVVDPANMSQAPSFNAHGIEKTGNVAKPGFEKGPYTSIEGFLQLRNPIMMPNPDAKPHAGAASGS